MAGKDDGGGAPECRPSIHFFFFYLKRFLHLSELIGETWRGAGFTALDGTLAAIPLRTPPRASPSSTTAAFKVDGPACKGGRGRREVWVGGELLKKYAAEPAFVHIRVRLYNR